LKSVPRIADREAASCRTIGNPLHFSSPSGGKGTDDDIPSPLDRFPETIQVSGSIGRNGEEVKRARSCEAIESARKKASFVFEMEAAALYTFGRFIGAPVLFRSNQQYNGPRWHGL
jgi:hypothetical protein